MSQEVPTSEGRTVAVVGGGIAGLAAAWELTATRGVGRVVVLEAAEDLGGKIRTGTLGGREIDLGPDAFLARRPEALGLCREVGIADELVAPGSRRAYVWSRGRLRALPDGLALGIPTRIGPVLRSGILPPGGLARAGVDLLSVSSAWRRRRGRAAPDRPTDDRAIGDIVATSLGHEVVDRFVDPLIGGIHAGPVSIMSAAAVYPPLLEASARPGSLLRALRAVVPPPAPDAAASPVFLAPRGGLGRLVEATVSALESRGVDLRTSSPVAALERSGTGWRLRGGAGADLDADAIVLATPAPETAALLAPLDGGAARLLAMTEYATVVVVTFALPAASVGRVLDGTGFLVPVVEGWLTTACTWMSTKWPHTAGTGQVVLRASVGRYEDERAGSMSDAELADAVLGELSPVLAVSGTPSETLVTRWPGAFPQYAIGHLDRVDELERAMDALGGIAVAGAAYRGVGIPACIASGRAAARRALGVNEPTPASSVPRLPKPSARGARR